MYGNKPVPRTQVDDLQDLYSDEAQLHTGTDSLTRQEFKDEADINKLLSRFGIGAPARPLTWGEIDYDTQLQEALHAIAAAREAHANLPAEAIAKYPNWVSLLQAIETGQLEIDLKNITSKPGGSSDPGTTDSTSST